MTLLTQKLTDHSNQLIASIAGTIEAENPASLLKKKQENVPALLKPILTPAQLKLCMEFINLSTALESGDEKIAKQAAVDTFHFFSAQLSRWGINQQATATTLFLLTLSNLTRAQHFPAPSLSEKKWQLCERWVNQIVKGNPKNNPCFFSPINSALLATAIIAIAINVSYPTCSPQKPRYISKIDWVTSLIPVIEEGVTSTDFAVRSIARRIINLLLGQKVLFIQPI